MAEMAEYQVDRAPNAWSAKIANMAGGRDGVAPKLLMLGGPSLVGRATTVVVNRAEPSGLSQVGSAECSEPIATSGWWGVDSRAMSMDQEL